MNRPTPIATVRAMCLRLGINHDVEMRGPFSNGAEVLAAWRRLQEKAKESHRALVYDNHPDRGGSAEVCARLNEAWQLISTLAPQPPRPQPQWVRIVWNSWDTGTSSTTTGTW